MGFEVFAEGELLGGTEFVSYPLDLYISLSQQVLGLVDGDHVDPFHRGVTRFPFHDVRKVTRCQALFVYIIIDRLML